MLSGYRLLWIIAIFDLPTITKNERVKASKFRHALLDLGFEMVQFSVYMKHCTGKKQASTIERKLANASPIYANIKIIRITDKQFGQIIHLGKHKKHEISTAQLALF